MPEVNLTPEQRERLRQAKVVDAYRKLFGADEATRSEIQRVVWDDLKKVGYEDQPVFVPVAGALCPMRAAFADGRRSVFLYVRANATLALPEQQQQPQKPRRTKWPRES